MLNLRRGFRRLLFVASVAWIAGTGFYLWGLAPPAAPVDYDALAKEYGGVIVPPPPPGFVLDQPTAHSTTDRWQDAPIVGAADAKRETVSRPSPSGGDVFDLDAAQRRRNVRRLRDAAPGSEKVAATAPRKRGDAAVAAIR